MNDYTITKTTTITLQANNPNEALREASQDESLWSIDTFTIACEQCDETWDAFDIIDYNTHHCQQPEDDQ